jgi:hypothetical protein
MKLTTPLINLKKRESKEKTGKSRKRYKLTRKMEEPIQRKR